MNRKITITAIIIFFIIVAACLYVIFISNNTATKDTGVQPAVKQNPPDNAEQKNAAPATAKKGTYVDYSQDTLASANGVRLLFFYAPWCPQCRQMEESIKQGGLPDNVTVFKVDYDSNQTLRQQYGVTLQTTFVKIDGNGNKIASYVAYEEPVFSSVQRELLP